jgi:hypothetical protein
VTATSENGPVRTDFIDFPTAHRIAREIEGKAEHHPKCSAVQTSGGLLCDCAAVPVEWARRAIKQEPHREAEIRATLQDYLPEWMRTENGRSGTPVEPAE